MIIDFAQKPEYPQWAADRLSIDRSYFGACSTIAIFDGDDLTAVAVYSSFSGINCEATVAATSKWWMRKNVLKILLDYPFKQLGCKRLTLLVRADNKATINAANHVGFSIEGRLRQFFPDGTDCMILGLLREELEI